MSATYTESYVQVPPDSTGKLIDSAAVTDQSTGATKQRQVIALGDAANAALALIFGPNYAANALPVTLAIDQDPAPMGRLTALAHAQALALAQSGAAGAGFVPLEMPSFLLGA